MKIVLTEKQLKSIAYNLTSETDVDEQNEPVSAEPKSGTSEKQSGSDGYPEVGIWKPDLSNGIADLLSVNRTWAKDGAGSTITRGKDNQLKESVFDAHITTNGRYIIIKDNVFDVKEQKDLGDIWESLDTFKTIFQNTESDLDGYEQIREDILNLPILENGQNLQTLKQVILEFNVFNDTWIGRQVKDTYQSGGDFITQSWNGVKDYIQGLDKGEWGEIFKALGKGVLYIVRKLRDALYTNVGMVVDAILIATGIGKVAQFVVWSLVVGLDVYELSSGNFPEETKDDPEWMKLLFFGFDAMAMVITAAAIKPFRAVFERFFAFIKKGGKIADWFQKNPQTKAMLEKMQTVLDSIPSYMNRAIKYMDRKFPQGAEFLKGIVGKIGTFISKLKQVISSLLVGKTKLGKATRAGVGVGALGYTVDTMGEKQVQNQTGLTPVQQRNLDTFEKVAKKYENTDLFD